MSKSGDGLVTVVTQWNSFKGRFPNDSEFGSMGYPGINYGSVDRILDNLARTISALEERGAWEASPELAIADVGLQARLIDLQATIGQAQSNGVNWLLNAANFLPKLADAQDFLTGLAVRRFNIARELTKFLAAKGEAEIERIILAENAATQVIAARSEVAQNVETIEAARTNVVQHQEAAIAAKATIDTQMEAIVTAGKVVQAARQSAAQTQAEIVQLKADALAREQQLAERVVALDASVASAKIAADEARESVAKALRDLSSQGLAHSFQQRRDHLNNERRTWMLAFVGAIVILAAISIALVVELPDFKYETLLVSALRRLATAAPFIWLGWYAAKQISRVSRAQEDYAYKAASALAFQSYKDEVSADPTLHTRLLELAITTFGENPVRLQIETKQEAVSPLEDVLSKAKPEKLTELLVSALTRSINK